MKKNNSSLENKESRTTLPDMEIIDLEQDDTPAYEGADASFDGKYTVFNAEKGVRYILSLK